MKRKEKRLKPLLLYSFKNPRLKPSAMLQYKNFKGSPGTKSRFFSGRGVGFSTPQSSPHIRSYDWRWGC